MNHANMNHAKNHAKVMVRLGMAAAILGLAGAAPGQNEWLVDITYSDPAGVINSLDDTATVTLWAAFDPQYYAFERGRLDVIADDPLDSGLWSNPKRLLTGPGSLDGTVDGDRVNSIITNQLHFPDAGIFATTDNPIAAWTATWTTADLTPRFVSITSQSFEYSVYVNESGEEAKNLIDSLQEGVGHIQVVPAPGSLGVLFIATMLHRRGRRNARPH